MGYSTSEKLLLCILKKIRKFEGKLFNDVKKIKIEFDLLEKDGDVEIKQEVGINLSVFHKVNDYTKIYWVYL